MKKIILAVFVIALMVSCEKKEKVNYALVSGKIENTKAMKIKIGKRESNWKEVTLDKGSFKDTIFNEGYYLFMIPGEMITELYLENGFDIQMTLDAKDFDEITYKGVGNEINNYLANFHSKAGEKLALKTLFKLEEKAFLEKVNSFIEQSKKELKGLDVNFIKKQNKVLDYHRAIHMSNYEMNHRRITKNNDFKVSDTFPNPLENIDLENNKDFDEFWNYKQLVKGNFYKNVREEVARSGKENYKVTLEKIRKMKAGSIRNSFLADMVGKISGLDAKSKEIHDAIMELSTDEKLKNQLKTKMDRLRKIAKGNPSPIFENYENYKGGTTSLKDFKGKFVYIDVWATWCGPCKRQIPFMKELEEKYHGKDIVFVSISVDELKNKEDWKKMVKEKEMIGIQLFADKSWKSKFVQGYGINSIPRFILIDPKRNIIDANAPRPSDPKLIQLFEEVGIK